MRALAAILVVALAAPAWGDALAIHAHLYASNGKLEADDLVVKPPTEDVSDRSTVVWVTVDVTDLADSAATLTLVAREGKKVVLKQPVSLSRFYVDGDRRVVPFLVEGRRCAPLELTATLKHGKRKTVATATIPFTCS